MVTYKWPNWLRQQTEKQRIIWGYKILFLDVLFPLNLKKVIYVDADQVVRADLTELWNMDLQGKPYVSCLPPCLLSHPACCVPVFLFLLLVCCELTCWVADWFCAAGMATRRSAQAGRYACPNSTHSP